MLNRASNKTSTVKRLANNLVATFSWGDTRGIQGHWGGGGVKPPSFAPFPLEKLNPAIDSSVNKLANNFVATFYIGISG